MIVFVLEWIENFVWKGENAGYQHFPLFPQFSQAFFLDIFTICDCEVKG